FFRKNCGGAPGVSPSRHAAPLRGAPDSFPARRPEHPPEVSVTATPGSASSAGSRHLNGIAEIRTFFRTNQQPIYFVGPTAFNLLGIDRWVRNFQYIAYYDSWDGQHPRVFTPENRPYVEFESSEQINNYLLRDPEVQDYLSRRGATPLAAMVFFDEE